MKRVGFPSQGPFINNVEHIVKHKALYELALRDYLTAKKIVLAETIDIKGNSEVHISAYR